MHIILTHEQADFDAMASMLGAHLLNEVALPVLPRRMNRNVRAFLTLYGAELPFIEARDLPPGDIESVTLVDTQSLVTIKGMKRRTKVHVIDHHRELNEINKDWTYNIEYLGACASLFVEGLREHNGILNMIHATLLQLGIYEDTGSLTYASTTPRDLWAAAYLLEQGANLDIAAEYLNAPLSPQQRILFDCLLSNASHHTIEGQKIIISSAEAMDLNEEISSVAHKMRDLLELDALFILVKTSEGIRLIARSSTDQVDVSKIATHFGGGGHDRAAAALVQNDVILPGDNESVTLKHMNEALVRILPEFVSPSVTVKQIMSRQPMLLSPATSAKEASKLMQQYGYEGFPVVKDGKVIGLLTRRAVDRAIAHQLNLPASSLMEAGEVAVNPATPIDQVQREMVSSGWGQLPVVDPKNGEIIGIVTRTDLLTTLTKDKPIQTRRINLAKRLELSLPKARLVLLKAIGEEAHKQRLGLYIVGGFVRDLLLDRPSSDFDFVVEGDAISLAHGLAAYYGGRVVSHGRFGTAKWWIADIKEQLAERLSISSGVNMNDFPPSIDLISARTEFYEYPTALPRVKRGSIKLDLHRRDFSINTLALRLDGRYYGELFDYWGGLNDLKKGLVRVLHSLSFVDDPTRILRAVRFEQRFGFKIEERTRQLMEEAKPMIRHVSGARIRHELNMLLLENNPVAMLERLGDLGLLACIHPDLIWNGELKNPIEAVLLQPIDEIWGLPEEFERMPIRLALAYMVWLLCFEDEKTQSIAVRLSLPSHLKQGLNAAHNLCSEASKLVGAKPSFVVKHLEKIPAIALYPLYCIGKFNRVSEWKQMHKLIKQYVYHWQNMRPITDGRILKERGVKQGPSYRLILARLRDAWLDGEVSNQAEEETLLQVVLNDFLQGD